MKGDDPLSHEERYHEKEKKEWRAERKERSARDRSKYKKTDWDKRLEKERTMRAEANRDGFERGRVLAIAQSGILVDKEGRLFTCTLRGSLKKEKARIKNLIAVGDFVHFTPVDEKEGVIESVEERHSILSRSENINRRREQLIAVNIDQVLITTSILVPTLKPTLIDRYLIATEKGNMSPVIVINKIDLLTHPPEGTLDKDLEQERETFEATLEAYRAIGIPVLPLSATTGEGLDALKEIMQGKSSVFSGQSGTGKSSLINATIGAALQTGEIIEKTGKGAHTTTSTHLMPISGGGFCIDTPGIKSFGVWDLKAEEVADYYPEINDLAPNCKYPNCTHFSEPGCAVKEAVQKGEISHLRFDSYCALIQSIKEKYRPR
jgi:ribosome biogenesis GTPase